MAKYYTGERGEKIFFDNTVETYRDALKLAGIDQDDVYDCSCMSYGWRIRVHGRGGILVLLPNGRCSAI